MPEQHLYTFEPYLEKGYYYQFLAIGRDDKYATKKVLTEPKFTENKTKLEDARIALTEQAKTAPNSVSSIPQSCLVAFCKTRIPMRKPPYS